jgi:hypothetical protein
MHGGYFLTISVWCSDFLFLDLPVWCLYNDGCSDDGYLILAVNGTGSIVVL